MDKSFRRVIEMTQLDLARCAMLTDARYADPAHEAVRVELSRRLIGAAFAVEQTVRGHARCALVNHCGTHGSHDLAVATESFFGALYTYSALVTEFSSRFAGIDAPRAALVMPGVTREVA
jgi:hypothetical protein